MKTLFKLLLLFGLVAYLFFAFTKFSHHSDTSPCEHLNLTIADSAHAGFITYEEAERILRQNGVYPIGKRMDQINNLKIEKALKKNAFIDSVACYKSPNGTVNILIVQRLPLMRILADNGDSYYLDQKGNQMNPKGYHADIAVATGSISRKFARRELVKLGRFLKEDDFWDKQIEQIHVLPNGHLKLIPRVGAHTIYLGTTDSLSLKFRNLYTFYEKVLPQVGWNKYEEISVENVSQIVGTKIED
ncbi:MAG: cell division protein [Prevotellamassilia sp.]